MKHVGADAAQVDDGVADEAGIAQARRNLFERLRIVDTPGFEVVSGKCGHRNRNVLQIFFALLRGDDDFLDKAIAGFLGALRPILDRRSVLM